ncbi:MAG: hypothetical protein OSA97_04725 [Nevskia sp.]|nr:hypothetical protein [Nevskia sp.]
MTKQNAKQEAPKDSAAPTHGLYHIQERPNEKSFGTEIAVGWENGDGSINLRTRSGAILLPGQSYQLRRKDRDEAKNGQ